MCRVYYVTSPKATISRILTEDNDLFHEEKSEIFLSGLNSTTYQQIDDTSARVNGNNWYTQIICNPYYAAYFTVPHKNRETILDILLCGNEKTYCFNEEAFEPVSYTHLRAHETRHDLVCRLLLEKKKKKKNKKATTTTKKTRKNKQHKPKKIN